MLRLKEGESIMSTTYSTITANTLSLMTGQFGLKVAAPGTTLTNLGAVKPNEYFYGIVKALEASTVTLVPRTSIYGDATIENLAIPAGQEVSGKFDLVTVTAGKVVIYIGKEAVPNY